jgi:hypothetical protein
MFDLRPGLKLHTSMSFHATVLRRSHLTVFFLGLIAAPAAFGQVPNSPVAFANEEAITTSFVPAPSVGGGSEGGGAHDNSLWLKVEFHYGTTAAVTTNYLDEVQFKVWIEGLDTLAPNPSQQGGKGVAVALTGSVTYINVPVGKDIYGSFYVHPSTLGRYSSDRGYEDFDRKFDIHVEAYIGGALMDKIDKNKEQDPNWFQALKPIPNLVYRQDQCAFMVADPARYPAIKLPATAQ